MTGEVLLPVIILSLVLWLIPAGMIYDGLGPGMKAPGVMSLIWPFWAPMWALVKLPRFLAKMLTRVIPETVTDLASDFVTILRP